LGNLDGLVNVGKNRDLEFVFDALEYFEPLLKARSPVRFERGTVSFIVRGFEDEGDL
jgi:hypothetical protein